MLPCLEGEGCELLANRSGWTCTRHGGRRKTTTVRARPPAPAARGTGRPPVPSSSPALTAPAGPSACPRLPCPHQTATERAWGRAADRTALGVVSAAHRSLAEASGV